MHIANFSHLQIIHLFTSIADSQTREKKFQIWYIDEVTTDLCYHQVRVENTCIFTFYFKYTFSFSCNCSMQKNLVYRLFDFILLYVYIFMYVKLQDISLLKNVYSQMQYILHIFDLLSKTDESLSFPCGSVMLCKMDKM